jgi:hypothetical protein
MADAHGISGKAAYDPLGLLALSASVFFVMASLPAVTGAFAGDGMRPETIQTTLIRRSLNEGLGSTNISESYGSKVQMVANHEIPTTYFLDKLDGDVDLPKLPSTARDVVVAKVRALWNLRVGSENGIHPEAQPIFRAMCCSFGSRFWMYAAVTRQSVRNTTSISANAEMSWRIRPHLTSSLANTWW